MRILLIACTPYLIEKGSSLRVHFMVKSLAEAGHKVDVVCHPGGRDVKIKNVRVFRVEGRASSKAGPSLRKPIADLRVLSWGKRLLRMNAYDVIHGEDTEGGYIACLLGKKFKKPVVYDMHNRFSEQMVLHKTYPLLPFALLIERRLFRQPSLIITNWVRVQEQLKEKNPSMPSVLVYDAVHLDEKKPKKRLPKDYVAYAGSFAPYQGVELLIEAHRLSGIKASLVLVGDPTPAAKRLAHDNVIFTGRLPVTETNYIIKRAIFTVLPRVHGKQPSMKVIHYLLFKKAIIATDIECNHELLKDGKAALFVKPDVQSMAKGMKTLTKSARQRKRLEAAAAKLIPKVSPEAGKERLIKAYSRLK
jgi:glycosyltransferase involved in cell wall biosynthesis